MHQTRRVVQPTLASRTVIIQPPQDSRIVVQPSHDLGIVTHTSPNGFVNLGNSCYISSIRQCVFNMMDISLQVVTGDQSLLNLYREWLLPNGKVLNPSIFKSTFIECHKEFDNSIPQDAHEFFTAFLDFLEDSDLGLQLSQLLEGEFSSTLSCTECLGIAPKVDPFSSIELELGDQQRTDIGTLIDNFEQCEKLQAERFCSNCQTTRKFKKSLTIKTVPSWSVILFKRFKMKGGQSVKLSNNIDFSFDDFRLAGKILDLYGIVCHTGSKKSGHYYSFVLVHGRWFLCNDDKILCVSKDSILKAQKEAYMLFYKLRT